MHVNFQTPRILFQSYDPEWSAIYSAEGLVLKDPVVIWGFQNVGMIRWSDVADLDTEGVMQRAAEYGLKFGANVSLINGGTKSICGFARSDREFNDEEIARAHTLIEELHELTAEMSQVSEQDAAQLEKLGITIIVTG